MSVMYERGGRPHHRRASASSISGSSQHQHQQPPDTTTTLPGRPGPYPLHPVELSSHAGRPSAATAQRSAAGPGALQRRLFPCDGRTDGRTGAGRQTHRLDIIIVAATRRTHDRVTSSAASFASAATSYFVSRQPSLLLVRCMYCYNPYQCVTIVIVSSRARAVIDWALSRFQAGCRKSRPNLALVF